MISVETGQVLDYCFRSKICSACNKQKADKDSEEYKTCTGVLENKYWRTKNEVDKKVHYPDPN